MLVKNPVFLYFAVDDPFNSEMNATPAVISRCPFHIRVQTRMRPCEAKAPKVVKCADCVTNSFASHLCFWLVAELLLWKQKKKVPVRASCMGNILCSTCGLQPNQLYLPFAHLP